MSLKRHPASTLAAGPALMLPEALTAQKRSSSAPTMAPSGVVASDHTGDAIAIDSRRSSGPTHSSRRETGSVQRTHSLCHAGDSPIAADAALSKRTLGSDESTTTHLVQRQEAAQTSVARIHRLTREPGGLQRTCVEPTERAIAHQGND